MTNEKVMCKSQSVIEIADTNNITPIYVTDKTNKFVGMITIVKNKDVDGNVADKFTVITPDGRLLKQRFETKEELVNALRPKNYNFFAFSIG